ncbi:MAG: hypothetical protein ACLGHC_02440 [Alphaproteobacteria bacterium]
MTRFLAFTAALLMTVISVSSACVAGPVAPLSFALEQSGRAGQLQVRFRRADSRGADSWSSTFQASSLAGLDQAALNRPGSNPVRFAIIREAGRIDCSGAGGNSTASGTCSLTPDRGFNDFLTANGINRPTEEQTYGLIAVDARRELVSALKASDYPTPTIEKLMELSAVGVTPAYIRELAAQGYRPATLQSLVEFGALDITPDYIGGFVRAGYGKLTASELVQLKALNVTPDYVSAFERIGYGKLPVDTLVQMKALGVTPEFALKVRRGGDLPSPDRLVQLRAVSRDLHR